MSKKEIIEEIEDAVKSNGSIDIGDLSLECLQGILDLYKQEKEKSKYYEEELEATIEQSVSKHKIKEEIKKLNEKNGYKIDLYTGQIEKTEEDYQIAILKKLLRRRQ
jgi:hypothetical protein